jgi:hypothetical protein
MLERVVGHRCSAAEERARRLRRQQKSADDLAHYWQHLFVVCISVALAQLWAAYTVNKMTQVADSLKAPRPKDSLASLVCVSVAAMMVMFAFGLPLYLPNAGFRVIT